MDKEEYERQQREIADHAKSEGAWYYDPESPVIWKRYIIGPVPLWRRTLWWFFPPSHHKMRKIMRRRNDEMWKDAAGHLTGVPSARSFARVIFFSMAAPVILSAIGPAYYGFTGGPYWRAVVWALACTVPFMWSARPSFKHAWITAPPLFIGRVLLMLAIVVIIAVAFVAGDSLVYVLARSLS
jgi:hypothetical protein